MATATWNRGREAKSPREIPATGWKDILIRLKKEIKEDRLSMVSAAMAYFALFALVPAITSMILIYAWISDPSKIAQHFSKLSNVLPTEMQKIISGQLISLANKASGSWIILLVLYAVFLQAAYRYGPHRTKAKWKWVSTGAIVVMMLWFYITSFVILIGGEINAVLEHQTKKDTTIGKNKPMGQREARMADTLGESYGKNVNS